MKSPFVTRARFEAARAAFREARILATDAVTVVERVAALHRQSKYVTGTCGECFNDYPCSTIQAIQGETK